MATTYAEAQIWTGRYEGIDEWLQNSNAAVDTDEKQLQREGSRRLGEGALGGTPQKKLRNRYETGDRQGQQTFLLLEWSFALIVSFYLQLSQTPL
jgi:hypothetical protein